MKLVRFGEPGRERPGVYADGKVLDVVAVDAAAGDYNPRFFARGGIDEVRRLAERAPAEKWFDADGVRFGPPVAMPGKVVALGRNYAEHAREQGVEAPAKPLLFGKATSALSGANDDIVIPSWSEQVDIEVELALLTGSRLKDADEDEARKAIVGYMVMNDVSARDAQFGDGQWYRGKSCDTFAPLGPWLVTPDEIDDVNDLALTSKINGELLQSGNTGRMTYAPAQIVSYISKSMTLLPGDIVSTGTPPGVGVFRDPQIFLKPGDIVELEIESVGLQKNPVAAGSRGRVE